jgi:hypothetical protein
MTTRKTTTTTELRRCKGSVRFGIEPHEAPPDDFPAQPSQKDGLGRMCKPHWRQYTSALREAAVARKATESPDALAPSPEPEVMEPAAEPDRVPEPKAPAGRKTGRSTATDEVNAA